MTPPRASGQTAVKADLPNLASLEGQAMASVVIGNGTDTFLARIALTITKRTIRTSSVVAIAPVQPNEAGNQKADCFDI